MVEQYTLEAERTRDWQVWLNTRVQSHLEATMNSFWDALEYAAELQFQAAIDGETEISVTLCEVIL